VELNAQSRKAFVDCVGGIYEHSPWIAEKTWEQRPFSSLEELLRALNTTVQESLREDQLALIRAHPDLAGRLAKAGQLTDESTAEQRSAGLDRLSAQEAMEFERLNHLYVARFGFPFVICARLNARQAILAAFRQRLNHAPDQEIAAALAEIRQIAALRLAQIVHD
jgi:2-oxo-4-hydroxy-4-carboxy-5-ureidoimidazoline decarboxylase